MADCQPCCPPGGQKAAVGNGPCALPVLGEGVAKYPVNPMDPCCPKVCVPVMNPPVPCDPPKPRRKCRYIQPPRPKSYAPRRKFIPPEMKMEDNTIYRKSFLPVEGEKASPIFPETNLCLGEGKMSEDTVNKMSYLPHKALPPCPIYPCEHKLLGEGPMQDLTTSKHDYVPKPFVKPSLILPTVNLYSSDCPLSDQTVNRLSYMPIDASTVKVAPIIPVCSITRASGKISDQTIHNLSYQPCIPLEPVDTPWARQPIYRPPVLRMEDNTVNKLSYGAPGQFVDCEDDDPNCMDCPEVPCGQLAFPRAAC